ncbi:vacuolar carboxypeptidase Cps1 [Purpureocillium lavendulum]|uniref:Vacuolar carboxypeptidase Cps1 n=1 Tax=Purpureocillium lavendulum TaxID=1247861 RepID=A0AB34G302_9HYPO|nr:vacuolar carboxypeptidase Cps1 [Purpureocillium lavendulum]
MTLTKLSLLAGVLASGAAALVSSRDAQSPLTSGFKCDLPSALDPSGDGLPSANDVYSSQKALLRQVERHSAIVKVNSVCYDDLGDFEQDDRWLPFYDLHDALRKTYPIVHKRAKLEIVNTFGLVYTVEGSNSDLKPIVLAAHQDVVPWLWGRGSFDDKDALTAIMSSMEELLSEDGFRPERTIILAFGFDEECSGLRGAAHISDHLVKRYGENGIAMVHDEGGLGLLTLGDAVYALPAVYEKGYVDIWFELKIVGGHSSIPVPHSGIGIMSQLVNKLEANPYKPHIIKDGPVHQHLQCTARYSPDAFPGLGGLLDNGDLDKVAKIFSDARVDTHYLITTSQAVDMISGGQKINAMPEVITLGVDYRVAPQDSTAKVQHNAFKFAHEVFSPYGIKIKAFEGDESYKKYVAEQHPSALHDIESKYEDEYNGTLTLFTKKDVSNATPVSPTKGPIWDAFAGTIRHTFAAKGKTIVPAGETMTGNTDTRHYLNLTPNIYRWTPARPGEFDGLHTVDERILMKGHMEVVKFYYNLIRNFQGALGEKKVFSSSEL